jgi:hypothetical protein
MLRYLAIPLCLIAGAAAGADAPIPPPGITTADMRAAIKALDARKKMTPKRFEQDLLSAPIGKGRLE